MKKKEIYVWACDLDKFRGEGILANEFIKDLRKYTNKKLVIEYPKNNHQKINFSFYKNYITPFIGIIKIWKNYLYGRDTCYINFLPLWNFLIFLLLPPQTILGPITGARYNNEVTNLNKFIRKFILTFFSFISINILIFRNKLILFSTKNLESQISKKIKKKSFFNYIVTTIKKKKIINKKKIYDIFFYYREYSTHNPEFQKKIIEFLAKYNYKIVVAGNKCNVKNTKEIGFVKRSKIRSYLNKTKFSLNEETNFLSFFTIDSLESGCSVICNKKTVTSFDMFNKKSLFLINYKNSKKTFLKIKKIIDNYKDIDLFIDIKKIKKYNLKKKLFMKKYFSN
jgi:hypothetical protein